MAMRINLSGPEPDSPALTNCTGSNGEPIPDSELLEIEERFIVAMHDIVVRKVGPEGEYYKPSTAVYLSGRSSPIIVEGYRVIQIRALIKAQEEE